MNGKKLLYYVIGFLLVATLVFIFVGNRNSKLILSEHPIFVKTIDRPDGGVGEVILLKLAINGYWTVDSSDSVKCNFKGKFRLIGLEEYDTRHFGEPAVDVDISFTRESDRWVGKIPYVATDGKPKTLLVYTDERQSMWVFEGPDRISFAPADHINNVLEICSVLDVELK